MEAKSPKYADLAGVDEDTRIDTIGRHAMAPGAIIAFVVEDSVKRARYLLKLFVAFPQLELHSKGEGPVSGSYWAKVWRSPSMRIST